MKNKKQFISIIGLSIIATILFSLHQRYYDYSDLLLEYPEKELYFQKSFQEINYPIDTEIHIDENKSLGALKIFISSQSGEVFKPYQLSILHSNCDKLLYSAILDLSKISQGSLVEPIPPRFTSHLSKVCIRISPYGYIKGDSLTLQKDLDGSVKILPLYRR